MLDRLGIASEFKGGYRVTTPEAMDVVRMVLTGQVSRSLVTDINEHAPLAQAISGEDAGLFVGERRGVVIDGDRARLKWFNQKQSILTCNESSQRIREELDACLK